MKLMTELTELQKKTMGSDQISYWQNRIMEDLYVKTTLISAVTGVAVEDIIRFSHRTSFSLNEVLFIFSRYGEEAFEIYKVDRYPRVCDGD